MDNLADLDSKFVIVNLKKQLEIESEGGYPIISRFL